MPEKRTGPCASFTKNEHPESRSHRSHVACRNRARQRAPSRPPPSRAVAGPRHAQCSLELA
jgi:hypothetical protein